MTRSMSTPGRYEEVLTHRTNSTANRRLGEPDGQSDPCFDTEDDCCDVIINNNKQQQQNYFGSSKGATTAGVASSPRSPRAGGGSPSPLRRRRRKRNSTQGLSTSAILLFSPMLLLVLSLLLWSHLSSSTEEYSITPSVSHRMVLEMQTNTKTKITETNKPFEKLSHVGSASCSNPLGETELTFTLVTQVSADRLWMMEHQCQRWGRNNSQYPISIAVFTNETTPQVEQKLLDWGCDMEQMAVTTLSAKQYPSHDYPVNVLRNMALSVTKTTHAVLVDIDFWVTQDLAELLHMEEVSKKLVSDPKAAIVIPAFQLNRQCKEWRECPEENIPEMPLDLRDLKQQILDHKVSRFDPTNRGGHGSTKYKEWFKQNHKDGETLLEIDCFLSNRYEPYLVFRLCWELPPFQEAFAGYGKNKMTWVMQLRRMGYTFWQLGKGAFVIHYPHLDSPSRVAWNAAPQKTSRDAKVQWQDYKRGRMDQLFVQFREWLQRQIPDQTRTPFCEDKLNDDARLWYDREAFLNATTIADEA